MQNDKKIRQTLVEWLRDVMRENDWSAEDWARHAGTSPTNLTRLLSRDDASLPGTETLFKLSRAAGSQPDLIGLVSSPKHTVPLFTLEQIIKMAHALPVDPSIELPQVVTTSKRSKKAFAAKIETDTLNTRGLLAGDIVVIEPDEVVVHGALVAVLHDETLKPLLYHPPFFMPQSSNAAHQPVPMDQAIMIGRIVQIVRDIL